MRRPTEASIGDQLNPRDGIDQELRHHKLNAAILDLMLQFDRIGQFRRQEQNGALVSPFGNTKSTSIPSTAIGFSSLMPVPALRF